MLRIHPQLRPMTQPPPPTGCTGRAPPGAGGTGDVESSVGGAPRLTATTNAATQAHSAARVLAFGAPTGLNSAYQWLRRFRRRDIADRAA